MIEAHYISIGETTNYRVRPNPDGDDASTAGVVLEWSDDGGKTWDGYFHIAPQNAAEVARSILLLMTGKAD